MTHFSKRIHQAFDLAAIAHDGQSRKDPDLSIPYFSHLAGVAHILAQYGFEEDVVIAGALHDIIEDVIKKGKPEYERTVKGQFGEYVYELVDWVSQVKKDQDGNKLPWDKRVTAYIHRIENAPAEAKAISCADKIHNIQSLIMGIDRGTDVIGKLKAGPTQQVEKFESLHAALNMGWSHPMLDELSEKIETLKKAITSSNESTEKSPNRRSQTMSQRLRHEWRRSLNRLSVNEWDSPQEIAQKEAEASRLTQEYKAKVAKLPKEELMADKSDFLVSRSDDGRVWVSGPGFSAIRPVGGTFARKPPPSADDLKDFWTRVRGNEATTLFHEASAALGD